MARKNTTVPDITADAWKSWQPPLATTDPSRLMPNDDSSETKLPDELSGHHSGSIGSDSYPLAIAFGQNVAAQHEGAKRIELVEPSSANAPENAPTPRPAAAPKTEARRILWISVASAGLLAFRKFRRPNPGVPKPSFL
jgi:hypothetical protein